MDVFVPIIVALITAVVTTVANVLVFGGQRAKQLDARLVNWTNRLEGAVESSDKRIEKLERRMSKQRDVIAELQRWVGDVRRDLSAIHLCLDLAIVSLNNDESVRASGLMRDALERVEALRDETHGLVEDSTPLAEPIEEAS